MRFRSQRSALPYLTLATVLFGLQALFGLLLAAQFVWPELLSGVLPFNVGRMIHLNLMVFWLLLGMMGATYYLVPDEAGVELASPGLAVAQFWLLALTGVGAVAGFLFGFSEGREYLEAPRFFDWLIALGAVVFLLNVLVTLLRSRKWTAIIGLLFSGLAGLSVIYLTGMIFFKNLVMDQIAWWWVIHLWVEGTWELIAAAITAWLLLKLTGIDRETLNKYLYLEVGLVLLTGILGTGHHYYWIGTPRYWLWIGGIFSALEPVPLVLMVLDTFRHLKHAPRPIANRTALLWVSGAAVAHLLGAGLLGLVQTIPQVNQWTHGTQMTAAHGHLAFYGAYAMLVIAAIYYILPELAGRATFDSARSRRLFWALGLSMVGMTATLMGVGIVQVYTERILGIDFSTVKSTFYPPWMALRAVFGIVFTVAALGYVRDYLALYPKPVAPGQTPAVTRHPHHA